jgi:hypothetical protein
MSQDTFTVIFTPLFRFFTHPIGSTHVRHMFDTSSSELFHVKVIKSDANFGKKNHPQKTFR